MSSRSSFAVLTLFCVLAAAGLGAQTRSQRAPAQPAAEAAWLGSPIREEPSPTVTALRGVGTANAMAEARMTQQELATFCKEHAQSYQSAAACLKQKQSEYGTKIFRASADCTTGQITTTGDQSYTLDGLWDNSDIGSGRTRWRDADGNVVGRDLINNGLHISQQWETLCPGPVTPALIARAGKGGGAPAPAAPPAPPVQAPPAVEADACNGNPRCFDSGVFVAEILNTVATRETYARPWHTVRLNIRFRNKTTEPIILGYMTGSAVLIDDLGNRYAPSTAPDDAKGIGKVAARSADPQFILRPGESRQATFGQARVMRGTPNAGIVGSTYNFDISIAQLQIVNNGQQVRTVREHALTFPGFGLGSGAVVGAGTGNGGNTAENVRKTGDAIRALLGGNKK